MMAVIEEMEKEKMEFLEKMCKDDREHELRLLQILGQMMVPQSPHSPSLYYPLHWYHNHHQFHQLQEGLEWAISVLAKAS